MGSYRVFILFVNYYMNPGLHIIFNLNYSSTFFLKPTEFINLFSTSVIDYDNLPTLIAALLINVCSNFGSIKNFSLFFMLTNSEIMQFIIYPVSFVATGCIFWSMEVQFLMKLLRKSMSKSLNMYSLKRLLKKTNILYVLI